MITLRSAFLLLLIFLSSTSKANELKTFIPEGYSILDTVSGKLNRDDIPDLILVLKRTNEVDLSKTSDYAIKRILVVLLGLTDHTYQLAGSNADIIYCHACGDQIEEPYQKCTIENFEFTIEQNGGSAWRWSRSIAFALNTSGNFILTKDVTISFAKDNIEATKDVITKTGKELGSINFDQFDIDKE